MKKENSFLCWICSVAVLVILFAPSLMANPVSKTTSDLCFIATSKAKLQIVEKFTLKAIEGFDSMFDFMPSFGVVASSEILIVKLRNHVLSIIGLANGLLKL